MKTKTPRELQGSEVGDWLHELEVMGADVSHLEGVREQWELSLSIGAKLRRLREQRDMAPRTPVEAAARRVARGDEYDAEGVRVEILSRGQLETEIDAHELAMDQAGVRAFQLLAARKDRNVTDLLRPVYLAAAEDMVRLRGVVGEDRTLEQAARNGNASEWIQLEARYKTIRKIRELHDQWLVDGIVRNAGARTTSQYESVWKKYSHHEFYFRDRMVVYAAEEQRVSRNMFGEADLFAAAGPALRTIADIDAEWRQGLSNQRESAEVARALGGSAQVWDAAKEAARAQYMQSVSIKLPGS